MSLRISNRDARNLWLNAQDLASAPIAKPDTIDIIKKLGYVQLDSIPNVVRAHHHILWSRDQSYREPVFDKLMQRDRSIFEHFTHDASVLPMDFYPMWQRQFKRQQKRIRKTGWYKNMSDSRTRRAMKQRIADEGPLSTKAFDSKVKENREMWARPPHKLALDYMWYSGELSTSHREKFTKFYDLSERVIPDSVRRNTIPDDEQRDWLCQEALSRLSFGNAGEIKRFWDAVDSTEARDWLDDNSKSLVEVEVQAADRSWFKAVALKSIRKELKKMPEPGSRVRLLNPFDPLIRDRKRLQQIFGFDYRIEIFVPAAKREWGYYVYPLLEGTKFIGRIELTAERKTGTLKVVNFWPEAKVRWQSARFDRLDSELQRFARFAGLEFDNTIERIES